MATNGNPLIIDASHTYVVIAGRAFALAAVAALIVASDRSVLELSPGDLCGSSLNVSPKEVAGACAGAEAAARPRENALCRNQVACCLIVRTLTVSKFSEGYCRHSVWTAYSNNDKIIITKIQRLFTSKLI